MPSEAPPCDEADWTPAVGAARAPGPRKEPPVPRAHSNAGTFGWLGAGTRWHDDGAPLAEAGRGGTHALL